MNGAQPAARRILVIDDNEQIRGDFKKILATSPAELELARLEAELLEGALPMDDTGFELAFAGSGEKSIPLVVDALARGEPFALAFVDVRMPPGWDGIKTASELWRIDPRLQIVFCTAHSDYSWEEMRAKLASRDNFLVLRKPFDAIEVCQLAHAQTEKWRLLRDREQHLLQLEAQVRERTAQLLETNTQLAAEMENRLYAEQALRHSQKLEALGRMSAGICHEINNPLTYVIGNLFSARDILQTLEVRSADIDDLQEMIADAASGAERIGEIVRQMRGFVHPGQGVLGEISVAECVEAARRITDGDLRHRGALAIDVPDTMRVIADRVRLEQVLVNILLNASQALNEETSDANEVRLDARLDDEGVAVIEIRDNGCGIAVADIERVFDPFFTTKPVGQGSGLGLSTSRGIVQSFGGKLEISSSEGFGTVVRMTLRAPASKASVAPSSPGRTKTARPPKSSHRILVIDDEAAILRMIEWTLPGYHITKAAGGEAALEAYRAEAFDLILCDVMMPRTDGSDVYEKIAQLGEEHARKFVFMTGGACTERTRKFLEGRRNPVINKPLERTQLREIVERMVGGGA